LLEQSAADSVPANGCGGCAGGRDRFTGAGRLDQFGALDLLSAGAPPRDRYETNDTAGTGSYPLFGARRDVGATIDYWNDRDDVYRVYLRAGQRLAATWAFDTATRPALMLWRPGTTAVDEASIPDRRLLARPAGAALSYTASAAGWYILDVRMTRPGGGAYRLLVDKT